MTPEWAKTKGAYLGPRWNNSWSNEYVGRSSTLAVAAIVAATISLGMSLYVFGLRRVETFYKLQSVPVYPFRRPNPYINLENTALNGNSDAGEELVGHSQLILQIDNTDPSRRMVEDHRTHWTEKGTVYPDDRHFIVSSLVHVSQPACKFWLTIYPDVQYYTVQSGRLGF
jgi:hypothetical protein